MKIVNRLTALTLLLALAVLPVGTSLAQVTAPGQYSSFQVQAVGDNGEPIAVAQCRVLTAGTFNTDAIVYTTGSLATASTTLAVASYAPTIAADTQGTCTFYAATGTNTFDVIVYIPSGTYAGLRARADGVSRTGLKRVSFNRHTPYRMLSIPFTKNTGTQTSTTKLPAGAVVTGAEAEVTTAVASSTVSFGAASPFAGTTFCNAQSAAAAGFFNCGSLAGLDAGTAAVALTYVTSNHSITGLLNVFYTVSGGN